MWSGSGGTYWIGSDMTHRRAWGGRSRWAFADIVMAGPAKFDVRIAGQFERQGTCVPAETVAAGCGKRTISKYAVGIGGSWTAGTRGEIYWSPLEYKGQRRPDYSGCGYSGPGRRLSVQPHWVIYNRYAHPAGFTLSSVPPASDVASTRARANKVAAARILATRVGGTHVLRAQDRPRPNDIPGLEGTWTGRVTLKRIR